jgi:hypothetical protein
MTQDLEHLKKLVLSNGWDEESKQQVRDLEDRLHKLSATERLTEHPAIADYLAYLRSEIARCKEVLSEDDKLTDRQQDKLFEKIKQCREFIQRFDPAQKREVEKTIKDLLNVAKSQSA